jgi:hypothetical protein
MSINYHEYVYKQQDLLLGTSFVLDFLKAKTSIPILDKSQDLIPFYYACRELSMFRFRTLDYELCTLFVFFNNCAFEQTQWSSHFNFEEQQEDFYLLHGVISI